MDVPQDRAQASLRTALWRIRQAHHALIRATYGSVALVEDLEVDLHSAIAQARRLLRDDRSLAAADVDTGPLECDLLPGWDEDWVLLERERLRQLRIHALEALSERLRILGRYAESIEAAHAAVSAEPLRESAQTVLIRAFLAEGNYCEARRQFESFRRLLMVDLRTEPATELARLIVDRDTSQA
jgi:DNA-binding SARP family transcriptional activator